jgi:hypothetical protein
MVKQKVISISQELQGADDDIIIGEFVEIPDIDPTPDLGLS